MSYSHKVSSHNGSHERRSFIKDEMQQMQYCNEEYFNVWKFRNFELIVDFKIAKKKSKNNNKRNKKSEKDKKVPLQYNKKIKENSFKTPKNENIFAIVINFERERSRDRKNEDSPMLEINLEIYAGSHSKQNWSRNTVSFGNKIRRITIKIK